MKRTLIALLVFGFPYAAQGARTVDIGDARALDAIQASNPAQYEKVLGIIQLAGTVECETLPQMLKVQYDARNVQCAGAIILTSYPAKRRLFFHLDDTAFSGNVVLTGKPGTLQPAVNR